jgi:hypothetical protein
MNTELTIKIESHAYIAAERALRITSEQYKLAMFGESPWREILDARLALGFSMHQADMLTDYVEPGLPPPCNLEETQSQVSHRKEPL